MNNKLSDRLQIARKMAGITQRDLAEQLGVVHPTLNKYERGHRTPDADLLRRVAEITRCDPAWLLMGDSTKTGDGGQRTAYISRTPVFKKIPGDFPEGVMEEAAEYISLPDIPSAAVAIQIAGESMSPAVRDGDYAIFIPDREIDNGDMIIVNNEWGDSLLRRYREKDGSVFLTSDNPEYPSVPMDSNYAILGKVLMVWRRVAV